MLHGGFLTNQLRVIIYCLSYELLFTCELELLFIARVTSYFLDMSYELLLAAPVTSYFLDTSYELLLVARVMS